MTSPEPLPGDSPLWELPNVMIASHSAAHSPEYWERGIELLVDNLRRFLQGKELRNLVDPRGGTHHGGYPDRGAWPIALVFRLARRVQ